MDSHGEQYQNMVNASLSREILRKIQPDMIFSGDDHDWCEIAHSMYGAVTPEVTLPTFSFAQGIRQPGFVMLSLYNPEEVARNPELVLPPPGQGYPPPSWIGGVKTIKDSSTFAYEACMLPNQLSIYNGYIVLLAVTLGCIVVTHFLRTTKQAKAWCVGKSDTPIFWRDDPFSPSPASCTPTRHGTKGAGPDGVHPLNMEEFIPDLEKTSTTLTALSTPTGLITAHMSPKIQHEPFAKSNSASTTSADLGNDEWVWPTLQSTSDTHLSPRTSASSLTDPNPTTATTPMPKRTGSHYGEKQLQHPQQYQHHRPRPQTLFSFVQEYLWPLHKGWFWTLVIWDLVRVFRVVLPFYFLLLVVSIH